MSINRVLLALIAILWSGISSAQENNLNEITPDSPKLRISINRGYGFRIASTKESKQALLNQGFEKKEVDSYFSGITKGPKFSAQLHYCLQENYALGIDYQFHTSQGKMKGTIDPGDALTLYYGEVSDNIFTNYAGASYYFNEPLRNSKLTFSGQVSLGLTFFRQENKSFYSPVLITGKAPGANLQLGIEYFLTKTIAFGIQGNLFQSTISKIKVNDGNSVQEVELEKEMREGLGRIDVSAGLKIYL